LNQKLPSLIFLKKHSKNSVIELPIKSQPTNSKKLLSGKVEINKIIIEENNKIKKANFWYLTGEKPLL
jgi:hypothetical protein